MISPLPATEHSHDAVFTASPMTVYCIVCDEPIMPQTTDPMLMPMPMSIARARAVCASS